jgi:diguanylate cyclase (GGDEF)-like protein
MGQRKNKNQLLRRVSLLYFFMNAVSIALFTYVITSNQASLISDLTRYQAKEVMSLLVQNLRKLPEISDPQVDIGQKLNALDTSFSRLVSHYAIFNKEGVLRQSENKYQLKTDHLASGEKSRFLNEFSGMDYFLQIDQSQKAMRFYIALENFGMTETFGVAELKIEEITKKFKSMYQQIAFTIAALSLLHLLFAYFIFRIVLLPIIRLQNATKKIARGDYDATVPITGSDEISDLAENFNRMTGTIRRTVQELEENVEIIRQSKEKMELMANMDELMQIHNRRYVMNQLERLISIGLRYGNPLSAIMIDVDHFKSVNDDHGHHTGDLILQQVASRLKSHCRNSDILARYGGEELILVMPETELDSALTVAEKLRASIETEPFKGEADLELSITVSLGVAELTRINAEKRGAVSVTDLLGVADAALYFAKENGRNQVCNGHRVPK